MASGPSPAHSRPGRPGRGRWTSRRRILKCALLEPCFVGGGMSRIAVFRSLAVALGTVSMVAACGGGNQPSENLASDPTLSFPMVDDLGNLDPAKMSAAVAMDIFLTCFFATL